MRERGVQSRRVRPGQVEPVRQPGPPPQRSSSNFWQVLAILALVAATAGWTTAAVLALRPGASPEALAPVESFDPNASDDSEVPPVADTHDAVAMESLLPTTLSAPPDSSHEGLLPSRIGLLVLLAEHQQSVRRQHDLRTSEFE